MTPVEFRFLTPTGNPISNALIEIQLTKGVIEDLYPGVVMPRLITVTTDNEGSVVVGLYPSDIPYMVSVYDSESDAGLFYKFFVPELAAGVTQVRLQDIIVDREMSNTSYDEAALLSIHNAKSNAIAASTAAQGFAEAAAAALADVEDAATRAETAATEALAFKNTAVSESTSASTSATTASTKASEASTSAATATAKATVATDKAAAASASASSAATSAYDALVWKQAADTFASNAETSAAAATSKANEATTQANLATDKASAALASANLAEDHKNQASTSAANAAASASLASTKATAAETSATYASTQATAAAASATAALGSQNVASTKANEAATSATNSANSATASQTSATNAATSASNAATSATQAQGFAAAAANSATAAALSASALSAGVNTAAGHSAAALAIYGNTTAMQTAVAQAAAQASLAAGHAASASSVVQQDLSGVNAAALHRSPNAVTAMFVYDTSKDSDGGAWTEKCQHTSWYNEAINGKWLGAQTSESFARAQNAVLGPNIFTNGDFSNGTAGWSAVSANVTFDGIFDGRARITIASGFGAGSAVGIRQTVSTVVGKTYRVTASVESMGTGSIDIYVLNGTAVTSPTSRNGIVECIFVAANSSTEIRIGFNGTGESVGDIGYIDNASIKEVITQTTQPGDYFQLTTDGKFYKLNATSGTTEVFRGNKREFPKLSAIVAESSNVTIYDLTEPGRPMWMRFLQTASQNRSFFPSNASATSIGAVNGVLCIGISGGSQAGLSGVEFIKDTLFRYDSITDRGGYGSVPISNRTTANLLGYTLMVIANRAVNAVAMTVLPDAPVDPVTGLQVPTIAVATAGGLSLIRHNGTVYNITSFPSAVNFLSISGKTLYISGTFGSQSNFGFIKDIGAANPVNYYVSSGYDFAAYLTYNGSGGVRNVASKGVVAVAAPIAYAGNPISLAFQKTNFNFPDGTGSKAAQGAFAKITNSWNKGYSVGDERRAYLADVDAGSVSGTELVTNGTFDAGVSGWSGSITWDSGGYAILAANGVISQAIQTEIGKVYKYTVNILTSGNLAVRVATTAGGLDILNGGSGAGLRVMYFTATTNITYLNFQSYSGISTFDDVSVKQYIADRSYKAKNADILGTLTKSPVATGAQLVAYSGFSA